MDVRFFNVFCCVRYSLLRIIFQAVDMIGAARHIPQGVRFDLVHTLERFHIDEFAMSRFVSHVVEFGFAVVFVVVVVVLHFNSPPCPSFLQQQILLL